jgi:uncharacterized protein (TIGR02145 family)
LAETQYRTGVFIAKIPDSTAWISLTTEGYCAYDNDEYNVVNTVRGLAYFEKGGVRDPGWRITTQADFDYIATLMGGVSVAGGKMKETGTTHWSIPNTGATNESGFNALPAGVRVGVGNANFYYLFTDDAFMCSDLSGNYVSVRMLSYISNQLSVSNITSKKQGLSIRCVRDIQMITISSGLVQYRKGLRNSRYVIDYSSDGGDTWELELISIEPSEDSILIQIDGGVAGYRHLVRDGAYVIDVELTPTGFAGVFGTDWENVYTLNPNT